MGDRFVERYAAHHINCLAIRRGTQLVIATTRRSGRLSLGVSHIGTVGCRSGVHFGPDAVATLRCEVNYAPRCMPCEALMPLPQESLQMTEVGRDASYFQLCHLVRNRCHNG